MIWNSWEWWGLEEIRAFLRYKLDFTFICLSVLVYVCLPCISTHLFTFSLLLLLLLLWWGKLNEFHFVACEQHLAERWRQKKFFYGFRREGSKKKFFEKPHFFFLLLTCCLATHCAMKNTSTAHRGLK